MKDALTLDDIIGALLEMRENVGNVPFTIYVPSIKANILSIDLEAWECKETGDRKAVLSITDGADSEPGAFQVPAATRLQ